MIKDLLPNNLILGYLLDFIISIGVPSGIVTYIFWRWKTKYEMSIRTEKEKEIEELKSRLQKEADDLSQKLNYKIERKSKAYDFLIKKEFEFYDEMSKFNQRILIAIIKVKNAFISKGDASIKITDEAFKIRNEYLTIRCDYEDFVIKYIQYTKISFDSLLTLLDILNPIIDEIIKLALIEKRDIELENIANKTIDEIRKCIASIISSIKMKVDNATEDN